MTFDEWWDTSKPAATPETFAGWEQSCRQAWNAGLTAALADRERAIAEAVADQHVEAVVRSIQPHLDVGCKAWRELSEHCRYWLEAERAIRARSGAKGMV